LNPRRPLLPLLSINFIDAMGMSLVLPFLVYIVQERGGNALIYGLMEAAYPAFQFIGAPLLGGWSDRFGRKRILLLSQAGTLLSLLLFLWGLTLPVTGGWQLPAAWGGPALLSVPLGVLFLARALDGLTGGNMSVANAYLADISSPQRRKADYGKLGAAMGFGFFAGPLIAGALGWTRWGAILPVTFAAMLSAGALWLIWRHLPELGSTRLDKAAPATPAPGAIAQPSNNRQLLGLGRVRFLMGLQFLMLLAYDLFFSAFPVYAAGPLGWAPLQLAGYFGLLSIVLILAQGPLLRRIGRFYGETTLVGAGAALVTLNFLLVLSGQLYLIIPGAVLLAVGHGLMWPSFLAVVSYSAGSRLQGSLQGLVTGAGSVGSILGLASGGLLYQTLGPWVFAFAAGVIAVFLVLALRLPRLLAAPAAGNSPHVSG
jgi:MFS family permease